MASILVAQDCRAGSSPYRGRYDMNDPVIQPTDEGLRRHYLPVWRLDSGTESKVAFSIPPSGWFDRGVIDFKINQLRFIGVSQLGVVDPIFTSKKDTKPGNWAITGITQIGPQIFVDPFPMGCPIYAVPFVTDELAQKMIPTKQREFNGPVYVDEHHFVLWATSLVDNSAAVAAAPAAPVGIAPAQPNPPRYKPMEQCPVPWHPDLLQKAADGHVVEASLLKKMFPGEKLERLQTIRDNAELFTQFILSTNQFSHWKANFRVGNLLSGGATRSALEVTLRIGQ